MKYLITLAHPENIYSTRALFVIPISDDLKKEIQAATVMFVSGINKVTIHPPMKGYYLYPEPWPMKERRSVSAFRRYLQNELENEKAVFVNEMVTINEGVLEDMTEAFDLTVDVFSFSFNFLKSDQEQLYQSQHFTFNELEIPIALCQTQNS